jgi:hypothetical protein
MTPCRLPRWFGLLLCAPAAVAACPAPGPREPAPEPLPPDAAVVEPVADVAPPPPEPVAPPVDDRVLALDAGDLRTCAVTGDGRVFCWGALPCPGPTGSWLADPPGPRQVSGLPPIASIGVQGGLSCAVDRDGGVWCWGPRMGDPTACASEPQPARLDFAVAAIRMGEQGDPVPFCAETPEGDLFCFPSSVLYPTDHTCAQGDWVCNPDRAAALRVGAADEWAEPAPLHGVAVAQFEACAVTADSAALCWTQQGDEHDWRFDGHWREAGIAADVVSVQPFGAAIWALTAHGRLQVRARSTGGAWGSPVVPGTDFEPVPGLDGVVRCFDVSSGSACAVLDDGRVLCRGVATGGTADFQPVEGLAGPATAVAVGDEHACALLASGHVQCWGQNDLQQVSPDAATLEFPAATMVEGLGPAR